MKCSRCDQPISADDTVAIDKGQVAHLDCRRPRDLSLEERVILFRYCRNHASATCGACRQSFRQEELVSDILSHRSHLCPKCRADLTSSLRGHVYACAMLPTEVRRRAQEARDAARKLVKRNAQAVDRADVLMREAEVALTALRETMRRTSAG